MSFIPLILGIVFVAGVFVLIKDALQKSEDLCPYCGTPMQPFDTKRMRCPNPDCDGEYEK